MTAKLSFETAEALIYDPVASNRNATRSLVHSLGFRNVDAVGTLDLLNERLRLRAPDLLLCEITGAEDDLCKLVQSLRLGDLGANPFLVAIVTTWRSGGDVVGRVLNSGADDLLTRPFSTTVLGERLRAHIERRKGFVVTTDYIGPDRRRDSRFDSGKCEIVPVPNSLKIRTQDSLAPEEAERRIAEAIAAAKARMNSEKMRRDAFQLCVQWRMIEQRRPGTTEFSVTLKRIGELAAGIKRRAAGTEQTPGIQWCNTLAECIQAIETMMQHGASNDAGEAHNLAASMHLLGRAAVMIGQIFAPGETEAGQLVELDGMIARRELRRTAAGA